jgi:predicted transcriptional regulator YdeE
MFKIGDFSKLAQISVKTLRYYGELGLLRPAWIDRFSGYRYYTAEQLPRLNRILALKELGFSLEQIQRLLQDDLPSSELRGMLRMKQAELERQVQAEQERLERLERRLRQIEQEGMLPAYEVILKSVPPMKVVGIRQVVPSFRQVSRLFDELLSCLQSQEAVWDESRPCLAIYYDPEYREQGVDVEAAAPLSHQLPDSPPLVVHELPGADSMACAVHQGSYDRLHEAYNALMTWIENSGYRVCGPNRDVYLQAPGDSPGAASYVTEVQFPVQKKPVSIFVTGNQEIKAMEPEIVSKPAFMAVGMEYYGKNEHNEISELWQRFNPRMGEIKNCVDGAFGLCRQPDESGAFKYLAAFSVSSVEQIPQGMTVWEVPAQTYAVFPCTLKTIHATYKHIMENWLPTSGYQWGDGPDFEYYDETFDVQNPAESTFHIYAPVKPVK